MFLVADTIERRHTKIRAYLPAEPVVAVLLAAVDFEWTVRRAIVALGTNSNRTIRDGVLHRCHGPEDYKAAWKKEVQGRLGETLPEVVLNWQALRDDGFRLRNTIVHGIKGMPSPQKCQACVETFLEASTHVARYAERHEALLFGRRLPVRRRARG